MFHDHLLSQDSYIIPSERVHNSIEENLNPRTRISESMTRNAGMRRCELYSMLMRGTSESNDVNVGERMRMRKVRRELTTEVMENMVKAINHL